MPKRFTFAMCIVALAAMARPAAPAHASTIAIEVNEVQTAGATASTEFVELFNVGTCAADVGGYTLVFRTASGTTDTVLATIPNGVKIAPFDYYLFGTTVFAPPHDQTMTAGLAAAGGGVGLRDGASLLVDSVGYGTATNAFVEGTAEPAPASSQSIARVPNGTDTGNNSADFQLQVAPTPNKSSGGGGISCSVGGIAEQPDLASLPARTPNAPDSHHAWAALAVASLLLVATVGGWAVRRRLLVD